MKLPELMKICSHCHHAKWTWTLSKIQNAWQNNRLLIPWYSQRHASLTTLSVLTRRLYWYCAMNSAAKVTFPNMCSPIIQVTTWLPVTGKTINIMNIPLCCMYTNSRNLNYSTKERKVHKETQQVTRHLQGFGNYPKSQYSQESNIPADKEASKKVPPPPHPRLLEGLQRLAAIEDKLRFQGYSVLRWGLGLMAFVGSFVYIFREYIRSTVADEVSHVASRSLEDEMLRDRAQELAIALLNAILSDVKIQKQAVGFLEDILSRKQTEQAASNLVSRVVNDAEVQKQITGVTKAIIVNAFNDQEFQNQVVAHILAILQHEDVERTMIRLVLRVLQNYQVQNGAKGLAVDVIRSPQVRNETTALAKTLVEEVVKDPSVQKYTGDGLYRAFVHSITPSIFSRGKKQPDAIQQPDTPRDKAKDSQAVRNNTSPPADGA